MRETNRPGGRPARDSSKRERFEQAGRFPVKMVGILTASVIVVAVTVVVVVILSGPPKAGGAVVAKDGVDYADAAVPMILLNSAQTTDAETVTLSLTEVTQSKIGGFVYNRTTPMPRNFNFIENDGLPILAYVAPSGRLVVATSLCEPCRSYNFHISEGALVCNSCFTRWDLDTLKGLGGGCLDYPPEQIAVAVEGDRIVIQQSVLEAWEPRG